MKQVDVSILGQVYALGCPEGGESLLAQAVTRVDREMRNIRDAGRIKARERIAVLAALNLAYEFAEGHPAGDPAATQAQLAINGGPGEAHGAAVPGSSVDLRALLQRVDTALADDGQLL